MVKRNITVEMCPEIYEAAERIAALDRVSVRVLIECLVKRHAGYIDTFAIPADASRFSLESLEMGRAPGEIDEDYQARLNLFR